MDFLLAFCVGYNLSCALNHFNENNWGWGFACLGAAILCGVAYFT